MAALIAAYFTAAKLGLLLAFVHPSATAVWPPTGITLAAFLVLGYRVWPGIFIGAFLANITTAGSVFTSLGIAAGNTLEGLLGAYLINKFANGRNCFDRPVDVFKFALLAGLVSTTISATIGVTSLSLGGYADWIDYSFIWLTWWLGDMGGDLIVAPVLILWAKRPHVQWNQEMFREALFLVLSIFVIGYAVFEGPIPVTVETYPLAFLYVPILVWAGFRFGQRETVSAHFIISLLAIQGTLRGFGPFAGQSPNESLLLLQAFMGVMAVMGMALAAGVSERRRAEEEIRRLNEELEERVVGRTAALQELAADLQTVNVDLQKQIAERREIEKKREKDLEQVQTLHEIGLAISSTLDLRSILDFLFSKIDLVLSYAVVTVRLVDPKTGRLEPTACWNLSEARWKKDKLQGGIGLTRVVFETRSPLVIRNVRTDNRTRDPEFLRREGLVSYLGLPLIAKGQAIGVIAFLTKQDHEFDREEIKYLGTLANHVAMVVNNARLFERTRLLAADLEKANRAKDEFLKLMSHELRTPLHVIFGYMELIQDQFFGSTPPEQGKALSSIAASAYELLSSINKILEVVRIEAGEVDVGISELDLVDFLDRLRLSYTPPVEKKVTLGWDYISNLPAVHTDTEKLRLILNQLIENAIKFTDKGSVTVAARYFPSARTVEFGVRDTGIGIPKDSLQSIFERFRQIENFDTRSHYGLGLGLYVVKTFTEMLGGKVEVESEPGKGSTFTVTLPVEKRLVKLAPALKRAS